MDARAASGTGEGIEREWGRGRGQGEKRMSPYEVHVHGKHVTKPGYDALKP